MFDWVTISAGPPWQAEMDKARLEAEGIPVFLPDATMKTVDPFATGANPLFSQVRVPPELAERALEVLAMRSDATDEPVDLDALALAAGSEEQATLALEDDDGQDEAEADAPAEEVRDDDDAPWTQPEVEALATRLRWSALLAVTFPLALWYGVLYLAAVRSGGMRSRWHGLTLLGITLAGLYLAAVLWFGFLPWML